MESDIESLLFEIIGYEGSNFFFFFETSKKMFGLQRHIKQRTLQKILLQILKILRGQCQELGEEMKGI